MSKDPVAADIMVTQVIGFDPTAGQDSVTFQQSLNYLQLASTLGMGVSNPAEIEVVPARPVGIEDEAPVDSAIELAAYRGWTYPLVLFCQTEAHYYSDSGDSGAPVFVVLGDGDPYSTNNISIVGIHTGRRPSTGKRMYSPWSGVLADIPGLRLTD